MKVIVGLGNPGKEYSRTRHNIGFMVLDAFRRELSLPVERNRFHAVMTEGRLNSEKIVLVAPQTFMNLSGTSVREVRSWYKIEEAHMIVVLDDMDLPFGTLRMRGNGSAGGHNGLHSIIEQLGTSNIPRLKIGIGRPQSAAVNHVLSRFSTEEEAALPDLIQRSEDAIKLWISQGLIISMNEVNRKAE